MCITFSSRGLTGGCPSPTMPLATGWLLRHWVVTCLLLSSLLPTTFGSYETSLKCPRLCYCSETELGGRTVRCSSMGLTAIPVDIPSNVNRIYLDYNYLTTIPDHAFEDLQQLIVLDLSHNLLSWLEPGAFKGLNPSLQTLDLSWNSLESLNPDTFDGLESYVNLTNNPWHCDCSMQLALPGLTVKVESLKGIVCQTSDPEDAGVVGEALVLKPEVELCTVTKKTTDVAMLVVMFGWFTMVISYLVYYVRANQEDARRHLEYLKSLPSRQVKSEASSTISTVV